MPLDCKNCSMFVTYDKRKEKHCFYLVEKEPYAECAKIPIKDRFAHSCISRSTADEYFGYEEELPSIDELNDWRKD